MGGDGEGAGSRLEKGLGILGGVVGGSGAACPGLGLQPSCQPSRSHGEGAAPAWGGCSPSPWQGPVVPGQTGSWEPTEAVSCGSLLEAPRSSLGCFPNSRAVGLQCQGEHFAMQGALGGAPRVTGSPALRQPRWPSVLPSWQQHQPMVTSGLGSRGGFAPSGEQKSVFSLPGSPGKRSSSSK